MDFLWNGIREAFNLWIHGDAEVIEITLRTLAISAVATAVALGIGVPLGAVLALKSFWGRRFIVALVNTGMGMPPVVVGLLVAIMLWRSGPFGGLNLIYTPTAMVIAQFIIAVPLVIGFSLASIQSLNPRLLDQIVALGANRLQLLWLLVREARLGLLAALMAGFGAVIS
jgi:tungstate transport system permease protein